MSFIGATGLDEVQEQFDILQEQIDGLTYYKNFITGYPDPTHTPLFGINPLNPNLFGLVERAEVNIAALQLAEEGITTNIEGIDTTISGIETEISGIQGEITGIQGEISAIQGEITGIEGSITALGVLIGLADGIAVDAKNKANRALGIWDESGNDVYHKKSGNVGIGTTFGSVLNNKLEVNGSINIPTGSSFKINNVPFSYSDIAGTPPVSSKWTNATDVATNIYYSGNVGIGVTSAINNKLEVGGNLNISAGSKYKINNVNLAFSDLGGTLSYNSLTDKLTAGTNISIVSGAINNTLTAGTNISIVSGAINNTYTYTLPTAGVGSGGTLGGVKVDNSTITITNGVISAAAATPQVNSDWTQTNTSLKSFIQNKPTAGNNISFANNTITNTITGSTTQNIIGLNTNQLIVVDKPNSEKINEVFVPLTNEPSITAPAFTESIRTFTHSGGTEAQTPYTITIGQNTICDILIVGGGGGGTAGHGAGGGAGQLVLIHQATLSGTYTIKVGKGGNGSTLSGTSSTMGTLTNGTKGSNSEFGNASVNLIAEGGGISVDTTLRDGGSGAGGDGHTPDGGVGGKGLKNTIVDTFSSGNVYSRGNDGGNGSAVSSGNVGQGGGGGGAGTAGTAGGLNSDSAIGHGGDGLSGISEINYDFKTNFGNYGKLEADGKYWFAGGGAGGVYYVNSSVVSNGGKGGGASTPPSVSLVKINGNNAVNGTGGGGAGGSAWYGNGGNGGSGIVIIKFRTIVNSAIPEGNPITYKTLNFAYTPQYPIVDVNNLLVHYKFDDFGSGEGYLDSSGNGYNLTARAGDTPVFSYNNSIVGSSAYENGSTGSGLVIPNTLGSLISSTNTTTGISISFWFSLALASNWADVLTFGFNTADYRGLIIGQPPSSNRFFIGMQNGTTFPYGYIGNANGGMFNSLWHHLVWTIDTQGNWKVYIDNILQTFADVNQGTNGVPKYTIPNYAYNNNTFFAGFQTSHNNGYIDDFRMYKKVLSVAEISTLYNISSVPRTFTLSVPLSGTGVIINNTALQYISAGTYTISVGPYQSSIVIAGIGQVGSDPYPLTNGSTIAFKYSMTQRTQGTTFYKKDGLIKYVPASGTNPSTGTWQIIDVDSQALTQFAGNLPFTRIDGNVPLTRIEGNVSGKIPISSTDGNLPASRIDNLALSLGMDLTGVNGVTQIKLTSGIVVVQGNLYSTGVNYFKYNVWHLDSDGFERFYFQQSNTTYIKGHGTTPFEFRNGANTNICTISGSGGLAVASYLQGSGAGGAYRLVRPDTWLRLKSADETTHLDFAAGALYAHTNLDVAGTAFLSGYTNARLQSVSNTGTDYVCVTGSPEADPMGGFYNKYLKIAYNSFTGFHRCYIEDELCNDDNIDIFKNDYIGRIVISTGKIKTDASRVKEDNEAEHEWYSLQDKEGITIEDSLPIIQLSRVRKDKRVYGVLGNPNRNLNNKNRIIVNGCGEGAMCVVNSNGNIENGDYIQTSDLLGYGEKQDDDIHRNYTIAKAVMDCTFELDNPNYECKELASGVRVAMIACVYKSS